LNYFNDENRAKRILKNGLRSEKLLGEAAKRIVIILTIKP